MTPALLPSRLPGFLVQEVDPTPMPEPYPVAWNAPLARELGIEASLADRDWLALLAGNRIPDGTRPVAAGYAGHQFGTWVPQLGDGRAIQIGDLEDSGHRRHEIQLKGAGRTRWSRTGDGRAVLRSTIREYLASAAMAGLGIPTTRALAIVGSDLPVYRERTETAAVLTRVATTHIRFGSFEWLASQRRETEVRQLADQVIEQHFPALLSLPAAERHAAWYHEVVTRTARLMAMWIAAGFSHGVMNTDNFSIVGDTLDYGPYGWLDRYDPRSICNHSDWAGRYAFDQQPMVGLWNCARLGEALYPLVSEDDALATLESYRGSYESTVVELLRARLGLATPAEDDDALIGDFLDLLRTSGSDYHRSFRALSRWDDSDRATLALREEISDHAGLDAWLARYRERLAHEQRSHRERNAAMLLVNPRYVLRNWVAQEVIERAEAGDHAVVDQVRELLDNPFDEHQGLERWAAAPPAGADEIVVSCSS
jgi:uncharacterized protein YdiU (UPF0061 family)